MNIAAEAGFASGSERSDGKNPRLYFHCETIPKQGRFRSQFWIASIDAGRGIRPASNRRRRKK
jgi:hypothetical protein